MNHEHWSEIMDYTSAQDRLRPHRRAFLTIPWQRVYFEVMALLVVATLVLSYVVVDLVDRVAAAQECAASVRR